MNFPSDLTSVPGGAESSGQMRRAPELPLHLREASHGSPLSSSDSQAARLTSCAPPPSSHPGSWSAPPTASMRGTGTATGSSGSGTTSWPTKTQASRPSRYLEVTFSWLVESHDGLLVHEKITELETRHLVASHVASHQMAEWSATFLSSNCSLLSGQSHSEAREVRSSQQPGRRREERHSSALHQDQGRPRDQLRRVRDSRLSSLARH